MNADQTSQTETIDFEADISPASTGGTVSESSLVQDNGEEWQHVGARIREARHRVNMSARELAAGIGVSPQHVSQVERGLSSFSASVLYSAANMLGISLDSLFGSTSPSLERPASTQGKRDSGVVLRHADRPTIQLRNGPRWERLTASPEPDAEFLEVVYPPVATQATDSGLTRHAGREYGVILTGRLRVDIGFESTVLEAGDSVAFDSLTPHRFRNASDEETRAVWFVNEAFRHAHGVVSESAGDDENSSARRYGDHVG